MKDVDKLNKIFGKTKEEALKSINEATELGHGIKMKKEALLVFDDSSINDSKIEFVVSRKYCYYPKPENSCGIIINYNKLMVDMKKISKEFEFCLKIKSIGERNIIELGIANKEYFSAIYVNGELYLKVED